MLRQALSLAGYAENVLARRQEAYFDLHPAIKELRSGGFDDITPDVEKLDRRVFNVVPRLDIDVGSLAWVRVNHHFVFLIGFELSRSGIGVANQVVAANGVGYFRFGRINS